MPVVTLSFKNSISYDTYISQANPTQNYYAVGTMTAGVGATTTDVFRALLSFDLGLIPNDAIINSATLRLVKPSTSPNSANIGVYKVTGSWVQGVTWNGQPAYNAIPSATLTSNTLGSEVLSFNVKDLVQEWVNGTSVNYGFMLRATDETILSTSRGIATQETATAGYEPQLTIDYTIPSTGKKQVEFVGQGNITNASATSITLPLPPSAQVGDLLVAQIYNNNDSYTISAPSGWTILQSAAGSAGGHRFSLAYKVMAIGEAQPNFSVSASVNWTGLISAFRNVKSVAASNIRGMAASTSASPAATSVTAVNTLFSVFNFTANPSATITPPPSYNEDFEIAGTSAKVQMMRRYMYNNKSQTSADMTSALSTNTYYGSGVLALEPLTNNPPTLALTSPTDNQTLSEGSNYPIEGSANDPDVGDIVSIWCKVNNAAKRAIGSGVSDGTSPISFARNLRFSNRRLWDGSTDIIGYDLAENTDHTLTVWAEDDKGGKSAEVTRKFRVVWNRPPVIDGQDEDLGTTEVSPSKTYAVTDPEGDSFTITEKVNSTVIRSFPGVTGRQETITIPTNIWLQLEPGVQHVLQIEAVDSNGMRSVRTYTFTRFENQCEFEIEEPWETDVAAKRILLTLDMTLPPGAILVAEATNNAFDAAPIWEDISFNARYGRGYVFQNQQKTAPQWGVSVRVRIEKGTATEPIEIKGFGGAFD